MCCVHAYVWVCVCVYMCIYKCNYVNRLSILLALYVRWGGGECLVLGFVSILFDVDLHTQEKTRRIKFLILH